MSQGVRDGNSSKALRPVAFYTEPLKCVATECLKHGYSKLEELCWSTLVRGDKIPTQRNLEGKHVCFGSRLQGFSCGFSALLFGAVLRQDAMAGSEGKAELFTQWQQGSRLWGAGNRDKL